MKTLLAAVSAAALFAGGALAQDDAGVGMSASGFDADSDARVSRDEFQHGFFSEWRRNAGDSGPMDEETFESSMLGDSEDFDAFDANDDGMLTEEEYAAGVFDEYDADNDELWDEDEIADYDETWGEDGFSAN